MKYDKREVVMTMLMTPEHENFGGNIHGGYILQLLDQVAYSVSARYTNSYCVTLSFDNVLFKNPVKVGNLVTFYGKVNYVGNTSLEVGIRVEAEDIFTSKTTHTNSSYVTMVCLGEDKKPKEIEPLEIKTQEEQVRFDEAKVRKEERNKKRNK